MLHLQPQPGTTPCAQAAGWLAPHACFSPPLCASPLPQTTQCCAPSSSKCTRGGPGTQPLPWRCMTRWWQMAWRPTRFVITPHLQRQVRPCKGARHALLFAACHSHRRAVLPRSCAGSPRCPASAVCVLTACAAVARLPAGLGQHWDRVLSILEDMGGAGVPWDAFTCSALLSACQACGQWGQALDWFRQAQSLPGELRAWAEKALAGSRRCWRRRPAAVRQPGRPGGGAGGACQESAARPAALSRHCCYHPSSCFSTSAGLQLNVVHYTTLMSCLQKAGQVGFYRYRKLLGGSLATTHGSPHFLPCHTGPPCGGHVLPSPQVALLPRNALPLVPTRAPIML